MPALTFHHEVVSDKLGDLHVHTGPYDISWSYGMNAVTYPTYGGEVVQILSVYTDKIQAMGQVRSYEKLEDIYQWFLYYMQVATQGKGGDRYNQQPITMRYPHRGWDFLIQADQLPGFRYARDDVQLPPEWRIEAYVMEEDSEVNDLTLAGAMAGLDRIAPGIGFKEDNPFSDPFASDKQFQIKDLKAYYDKAADTFTKLIPSYMEGDYDSLLGEVGSKPAFLDKTAPRRDNEQRESSRKNRG